jgi:hypothetical protein
MKRKIKLFALFLGCLACITGSFAQQIQQQSVAGQSNRNAVSLRIDTMPALDPNNQLRPRRFQAFWVTGDGNYIRYGTDGALTTVEQDAQSVAPPPYYYPATGSYQASAYLTGKYTNRKPPARAATSINIGTMPANATMPTFQKRLEVGGKALPTILDVFSNHAMRKNYLTTFVLSWPADVNASNVFFFYNGYQNHTTGENHPLEHGEMRYYTTDVPRYFIGNMDTSKIRSYIASQMGLAGAVDGLSFNPSFRDPLTRMFSNFVYYPAENVTTTNMPRGFTENRLFPVILTDTILPTDTLINFYAVITGTTPLTDNSPAYGPLLEMLNELNKNGGDNSPDFSAGQRQVPAGLSPGTPFALTSNQETLYVQAVTAFQVPYLATFDPNQLTVENITKTGTDEYEVTFRLEMCNQGQAPVTSEFIDIYFENSFNSFAPIGFTPINAQMNPGHWSFRVDTTISEMAPELPGVHQDAECVAIYFKARTNCDGVRALWKGSPQKPVQSCVVFEGAMTNKPECHYSEGIDSTKFLVDGKCECCREGGIGTDSCWPLWLLILLVVVFAIWWVYRQNNP